MNGSGEAAEREAIARQIKASRNLESGRLGLEAWYKMETDRGSRNYLTELGGLAATLEHIGNLSSNRVLDIGAGTARAISELKEFDMAQGIQLEGTGLVQPPDASQKLILTPAETLGRIPDASCGGVLAVFSIAYSEAPERVIESVDRVLVPGGIFKGVLMASQPWMTKASDTQQLIIRTADEFQRKLESLSWDVASAVNDPYREPGMPERPEAERKILVAVKPGNKNFPFLSGIAEQIIEEDRRSLSSQLRIADEKFPVSPFNSIKIEPGE